MRPLVKNCSSRSKTRFVLAGLAASLISAGSASATLISINTSTLSSTGSELLNTGSLLYAWNVNGNEGLSPVVNGITFSDAKPANITIAGFTASVTNDAPTGGHYSGDMVEIMEDFVGTNGSGADGTVTISGLTPGQEYRVQFFHHQDVNLNGIRQMQVHFGTTAGTAGPLVDVGNDQGYITIASFTADTTSQLFTLNATGSDDRAMLNAVIVHVPEPGAFTALLGGMGMLLGLRRRRA